jgi:hypothetical protein
VILEQEPLTNFRRDWVADDEFRLRVDAAVAEILRRERITIAWAVRRLSRDLHITYVQCRSRAAWRQHEDIVLTAAEVLAG